jgi:hypothetical protein
MTWSTTNLESHRHLGRDPEPVDESLIFRDIVGGVKVEVDSIAELVSLR